MPYQLVTRIGCHLCEEAEATLRELGIAYEPLDVDRDEELARLYDFRVPVLLRDGRPVVEGRLDPRTVAAAVGRGA